MITQFYTLKKQIKALIQRGELKEFVLQMISAAVPTINGQQPGKDGGTNTNTDCVGIDLGLRKNLTLLASGGK